MLGVGDETAHTAPCMCLDPCHALDQRSGPARHPTVVCFGLAALANHKRWGVEYRPGLDWVGDCGSSDSVCLPSLPAQETTHDTINIQSTFPQQNMGLCPESQCQVGSLAHWHAKLQQLGIYRGSLLLLRTPLAVIDNGSKPPQQIEPRTGIAGR